MRRARPTRVSIIVAAAALLAGCTGAAPSTSPSPSDGSAAATHAPSPSAGAGTPAATTPQATPTPSASGDPAPSSSPSSSGSAAPFERLPASSPYLFLHAITRSDGAWVAVLDPVTMCTAESTEAACRAYTGEFANDYAIINQSTKLFRIPFAPGARVRMLRSSVPDDFSDRPPATADYASGQKIVQVRTDSAGYLTEIKEWWHP